MRRGGWERVEGKRRKLRGRRGDDEAETGEGKEKKKERKTTKN